MNKRIIAVLGALAFMLSLLVATPASASVANERENTVSAKKWIPSTVLHLDPDEGFDDPITVYCSSGLVRYLAEGQWSKWGNGCADVDFISVLAGRQVVCWNNAIGVDRRVYYPGVHKLPNYLDLRCVHQLG